MGLKKILKAIFPAIRPAVDLFLSAVFDRKYMTGRHFDSSYVGYVWALRSIWQRHILRLGPKVPFPVALGCTISDPSRIYFHPDDLNNFQTNGTYFQCAFADIHLGCGCYIAPNVGIITANHDPLHLDRHLPGQDVVLGDHCWIGMNSVVLPGVVLGEHTVVAAGSVVTKSFPGGFCILAGTPAKVVKYLR